MGRTFRLGSILGFPIEINLTFVFLLVFAFITWGGFSGVAFLLLIFTSVLLHELGHALVARKLGVHIVGIELHFFGGAAKMANPPKSAKDEILIAVAGPAVSLLIGVISLTIVFFVPIEVITRLAVANFFLCVFNLIPALPMDGGRILRASLSGKLGKVRATEISVYVARFFAVGLGILGIANSQFFLAALALMLWFMASQELRAAKLWNYQSDNKVEIMESGQNGGVWVTPEGEPVRKAFFKPSFSVGDSERVQTYYFRGPDGKVHTVKKVVRW